MFFSVWGVFIRAFISSGAAHSLFCSALQRLRHVSYSFALFDDVKSGPSLLTTDFAALVKYNL